MHILLADGKPPFILENEFIVTNWAQQAQKT